MPQPDARRGKQRFRIGGVAFTQILNHQLHALSAFRVRKQGAGSTDTGWLEVDRFDMTPRTNDEVALPSVEPRRWDEFAKAWEAVYEATGEAVSRARAATCSRPAAATWCASA